MTDATILGALVFTIGVIAVVLLCGGIVAGLRERAYQRAREAEYAAEWQRIHKAHQYLGRFDARDTSPNRYLRHDEGAPE